jgi:hypothetical protein
MSRSKRAKQKTEVRPLRSIDVVRLGEVSDSNTLHPELLHPNHHGYSEIQSLTIQLVLECRSVPLIVHEPTRQIQHRGLWCLA